MKNKPIDLADAEEEFLKTSIYSDALDSYMEKKGYKWCTTTHKYVDDGSLELEWADRENDYRKENG